MAFLRSVANVASRVVVAITVCERVDLPLGFVLGDAVRLLDLPRQLIALAGDEVDVVVGQLPPLLLHLAGELLPVALNAVPVHALLLRASEPTRSAVAPIVATHVPGKTACASMSCEAGAESCCKLA